MLKFLLILILICYVFYKVGGFLFKIFFIGASSAEEKRSTFRKKAPNSNLDIDHIPNPRRGNDAEYRGGEYVDYEEVDK